MDAHTRSHDGDAPEFLLLGPLELRIGGSQQHVAGPRQQRLLAVLLLNADRVVASDALVDAVWGDNPPDTARRQLHNAIASLRRGLPPLRRQLVWCGHGYRLALPEQRVDAHRFTRALETARTQAAGGDRAAATRTLQAALRLWRGPALAGLTGGVIEAAATRLDEQRLDAQELLMELRLAGGESAALVPELGRLFDTNPLREGFAAQLMLALYRSGRQAAALDVYERVRATLAEELGVDPRPELRALHQRMLAGEADPGSALPGNLSGAPPGVHPAPPPDRPAAPATAAHLPAASPPAASETSTPAAPSAPAGTSTSSETPAAAAAASSATASEPRADGTPVERPDTLPYDIADFTGRLTEIGEMLRAVNSPTGTSLPIVAVDGMAGVGKTTLTVRVAHLVADRFPDGRLFVDLHGHSPDRAPLTPHATLDLLLRQLGLPPEQIPDGPEERVARWRTEAARRRLLLVFDNARDEAQVRPLLPGTAGSGVLVTSRRRLTALEGARSVSLDVLPHADGVALFRQVAGAPTAGEPTHVAEVVELCGRLPLAIRIAASRLRARPAWTVAHLAHRLRNERHRLAELAVGDRDVKAAFAVSHQQLNPEERTLFRRLGHFPGPDVDAYDVAALLDVPAATAERLLAELTATHLLVEHVAGRYHLHDLLASYARELADAEEPPDSPERAATALRLAEHYLHLGHAVEQLVDPGSQHENLDVGRVSELPPLRTIADAKAVVVFGHRTFVAVIEHAYAHGLHRPAARLAEVLSTCLLRHGYVEEALAGFAVGLRAARASGDSGVEASLHRGIGFAHVSTGRFAEALRALREGLAIDRERGDELGAAHTLRTICAAHYRLGQFPAALEALGPVVDVMRKVGSARDMSVTLSNLGIILTQLGEYDKAIAAHRESLALDPDNHRTRVVGMFNLGWAYSRDGRLDVAEEHLRESLRLVRQSGTPEQEGRGLAYLAECLLGQGRVAEALEQARAALTLSKGVHSPDLSSLVLNVLGRIHLARADLAAAEHCFEQTLRTTAGVELGYRRLKAHQGRAQVAEARGDRQLALHHLRQALERAEASGVPEAAELRRRIADLGGAPTAEPDRARADRAPCRGLEGRDGGRAVGAPGTPGAPGARTPAGPEPAGRQAVPRQATGPVGGPRGLVARDCGVETPTPCTPRAQGGAGPRP